MDVATAQPSRLTTRPKASRCNNASSCTATIAKRTLPVALLPYAWTSTQPISRTSQLLGFTDTLQLAGTPVSCGWLRFSPCNRHCQ
jgi:hypothetical protein